MIESVEVSSNVVTLTWSAIAGQTYQLQWNSDLGSTNWINAGSVVAATNGTVSASEIIGLDSQRFYRVILVP
jgi:hypothetical protein